MIFELPLALTEGITLFLPMDPEAIRELRSCCRGGSRNFNDANLRNFTLDMQAHEVVMCASTTRTQIGRKTPGWTHVRPWLDRLRRHGALRYLDLRLVTGIHNPLDGSLLPYTLSVFLTFPLGAPEVIRNGSTDDRGRERECERERSTPARGSFPATPRVAFVDVLERLRLSETAMGPTAMNLFSVLEGQVFPALERLALFPSTWWTPDQEAPASMPMVDFSRRFPRLSYLTLQCPRWDGECWEPTLKNVSSAPGTLRSLHLSFHMSSEETIVSTISRALLEGSLASLQEIGLRSTVDAYDGVEAMWDELDPEVFTVSARAGVLYRDEKALGMLGQSLGRLAPTLRRVDASLRCANDSRSSNFWTEMGNAAGPGGMAQLARVSLHAVCGSLLAVTELTKLSKLPALSSLELSCLRASLPDRPARSPFGGRAAEERREAQLHRLRQESAQSQAALTKEANLMLSSLSSGPPMDKLRTLSLGVNLVPAGMQFTSREKIAELIVSGKTPRLRRLWLFPYDAPLSALESAGERKVTELRKSWVCEIPGLGRQAQAATQPREPAEKRRALHQEHRRGHEALLGRDLLRALSSGRCPPALAQAFANDGVEALRMRPAQDWWGV